MPLNLHFPRVFSHLHLVSFVWQKSLAELAHSALSDSPIPWQPGAVSNHWSRRADFHCQFGGVPVGFLALGWWCEWLSKVLVNAPNNQPPMLLSSGYEGAKELGVSIFPVYSP